jgi:hypothetical protein
LRANAKVVQGGESSGKTCMHFVACFVWAPVARKKNKFELDQLMES